MKNLKVYEEFTDPGMQNRSDDSLDEWLGTFLKFLDHPWQEDVEMQVVGQLAEYRDKFEDDPSAAKDYFLRWVAANQDALDNMLQRMSDGFMEQLETLKR